MVHEQFLGKARRVLGSCVNRKMALGQLATHCEQSWATSTMIDGLLAFTNAAVVCATSCTYAYRLLG